MHKSHLHTLWTTVYVSPDGAQFVAPFTDADIFRAPPGTDQRDGER
jgi:hypothetical protein